MVQTTLFRKPTAGNTLLHASSFHPTPLLNSIPYSQYLRLRRICSQEADFKTEADALRIRLTMRGYSKNCIKRAYKKATTFTRDEALFGRRHKEPSSTVRLITTYNSQHNKVKEILNRHWYLLTNDAILNKYVKNYPEITFRRAKSIRDKVTRSHFDTLNGVGESQGQTNGTWKCEKCDFCSWIYVNQSMYLPNGKMHTIHHFVDCQTIGIVYIMFCICGAFYIGKTKRQFWRRIKDHIYYGHSNKLNTPIGRHIALAHKWDTSVVKFAALERIIPDERGGDFDKKILQREARWIFSLQATVAPGLNESMSYKPYL